MQKKKNKLKNRIIIFLLLLGILILFHLRKKNTKKVGIISVRHESNIGNNLLKYAISIKISELGYIPYIVGTVWKEHNNIEFIKNTTNLVIIKNNFSEIRPDDYDILMVNSDQTWYKFDKNFYDYGFLRFAENWTIPKFIYGTSFLTDFWPFSKEDEEIAKKLLTKFSGISVREKDSVELIKKHLGLNSEFVVDPTFLIDKKHYLNLIKGFKDKIANKGPYIFVYHIGHSRYIINLVKEAKKKFNFEINYFSLNNGSSIQNFLYYLINSKAVITNSFHGTIFSILFNKPFISIYKKGIKKRFNTLSYLFNISERLLMFGQKPNYDLLIQPLNINHSLLIKQRKKSINFLQKNLNI